MPSATTASKNAAHAFEAAAFCITNELLLNPEDFNLTPPALLLIQRELRRVRDRERAIVEAVKLVEEREGSQG